MNGEKFNSDRAPQAVGLYPHARKIGNLLFLSGVGPRKAGQEKIPYLVEILAQPLEQTNLWKEYQNLVLNSHVLAKLLVDEKSNCIKTLLLHTR